MHSTTRTRKALCTATSSRAKYLSTTKECRNFLAPYLEKKAEDRPELKPFEVVDGEPAQETKHEPNVNDEATIIESDESKTVEKKEVKKKSKLWVMLTIRVDKSFICRNPNV